MHADEYREVAILAHVVKNISEEPIPSLTRADLVDIEEIEKGIDIASKLGERKYTHHCSFNEAVANYIMHFGFSIHGNDAGYISVNW